MRPSQVVDVLYAQLGNINEPLVKGHVPLSTTMVLTCFIPRRLISPPEGTFDLGTRTCPWGGFLDVVNSTLGKACAILTASGSYMRNYCKCMMERTGYKAGGTAILLLCDCSLSNSPYWKPTRSLYRLR